MAWPTPDETFARWRTEAIEGIHRGNGDGEIDKILRLERSGRRRIGFVRGMRERYLTSDEIKGLGEVLRKAETTGLPCLRQARGGPVIKR